ncbi:diaminopimelate epimerase [uncultured Enterococcus sp.]|uniref:diaminopimelate epimerase n=1 Tax=uncultured Enterococcus sp. TaxID=167972 RepID=UPI00262865AB|nr:diaminopimelate epimerase [uncultured Enterococcus sp.]
MQIPFYKMQGTGNDFIIINNIELKFSYETLVKLAKQICQRKISVGSDALMVVDTPQKGGDFRMIFFNADGTEAEMCGNGARCLARYAFENQLANEEMQIETVAGMVYAKRLDQRNYQVQLNDPANIQEALMFNDFLVDYVELGDPGIPHLVVPYENLSSTPLASIQALAKSLRYWEHLPKGANVNFYEVLDNQEVVVRTFERGVEDFTLACGTGSGSTAYILAQKGLVQPEEVTIHVLGGILKVKVTPDGLFLIGDTNIITKGEIMDEKLASTLRY